MERQKERYSYSKIDTYKQCGYKFKLKYVDGHYISGTAIALDFGTLVHEIEENIANALKDNLPIDYTELKNKFILRMVDIAHKFPLDFVTPGKSGLTYREKSFYYLNTGIYRLENYMKSHPTYKIIGAEVEFNVDYDETHYFYGKIDRLIYDTATGNYIIHDVKTYDVPMDDDKLTTPLQFVVYTMAVKNMYQVPSEVIHCEYDLPLCDIIQPGGTAGYMTRGVKKLQQLFAGVQAEEFVPAPSPLCAWCEYSTTNNNATEDGKLLCPYHSKWTRDTKNFSVANLWQNKENDRFIVESYIASAGKAENIEVPKND